MPDYLFPPAEIPTLEIAGDSRRIPVGRIFCVGRNYAAHAAEMGSDVSREAPWFFTKSHSAISTGGEAAYPPGTSDWQHEVELVAVIGKPLWNAKASDVADAICGWAVGLDMTRRDLQAAAKAARLPWDVAKDVEGSAVIGTVTASDSWPGPGQQSITLHVNDTERQSGTLDQMVWSVPEVLEHLSALYHLVPGDIVMTGTPAGVGPVYPGDLLRASVDGLTPLSHLIGPPAP
ncbi:fumarylacetoacetate hydrolase family protein [Pelagovum pacificum]|uniref:Fumarylacetoacetate hydrolase family protein n=1 Tax=Pelagovum pacificum TaxID=2588711 RepID=A0A5C5GCI4_9RHOB|nr:fumarylacetoacetate hydrolase family protein [Pelagovum pacificum]QQA44378.1 fumarylacetoacetate hydrolase family protein [Pelagovum pacificum]TNY32505.1 fumarylacetoacetate hydrolase family protein [Pelagovum pacificum]